MFFIINSSFIDNISKAVQADKSFKVETMTPLQKHEAEKSALLKEVWQI